LRLGIKYIFGYQSDFGAYDTTIINEQEAEKIIAVIREAYPNVWDWIADRAKIVHQCHDWKLVVVGDPSIGGTMVSRWFECIRCKQEIDLSEWLTKREDICNK
jgi:hypothetical protein